MRITIKSLTLNRYLIFISRQSYKMKIQEILQKFSQRKVVPGGEVYLNFEDSLTFIAECERYSIPIYRIEILQKTDSTILSSLDKIINFDDQVAVYSSAKAFIKDQMNDRWNYVNFVVKE